MTVTRSRTPLTALEARGLRSRYNLADGHAKLVPMVNGWRPRLLAELGATPQEELEQRFLSAYYSDDVDRPGPQDVIFCPSASLAIDTVAKHLRRSGRRRVGLIEPAFDNLVLLLRAQELAVTPVPEDLQALTAAAREYDALVLVIPNNPTGWVPTVAALRALADEAASHDCLIVLDQTFRFYLREQVSSWITRSRCEWISIDDTGKTWSTLECKVSLLRASSGELCASRLTSRASRAEASRNP